MVRSDLPVGTIAAQLVHAAGESARLSAHLPPNTHAIVLAVEGERALQKIEAQLLDAGIAHAAIREPDAPWCGQLMAIGLAPLLRDQLTGEAKKLLRRLPLLKEEAR